MTPHGSDATILALGYFTPEVLGTMYWNLTQDPYVTAPFTRQYRERLYNPVMKPFIVELCQQVDKDEENIILNRVTVKDVKKRIKGIVNYYLYSILGKSYERWYQDWYTQRHAEFAERERQGRYKELDELRKSTRHRRSSSTRSTKGKTPVYAADAPVNLENQIMLYTGMIMENPDFRSGIQTAKDKKKFIESFVDRYPEITKESTLREEVINIIKINEID